MVMKNRCPKCFGEGIRGIFKKRTCELCEGDGQYPKTTSPRPPAPPQGPKPRIEGEEWLYFLKHGRPTVNQIRDEESKQKEVENVIFKKGQEVAYRGSDFTLVGRRGIVKSYGEFQNVHVDFDGVDYAVPVFHLMATKSDLLSKPLHNIDFATQLRKERDKAITEHANKFFEDNKKFIEQSAEEGYTSCSISLYGREDKHILKNTLFLTTLEDLLSGCDVKVEKRQYKNTLLNIEYERELLVISWKGEDY